MGPHQTDKILHSKGNQKETKRTPHTMGENPFKRCNWQESNLYNPQAPYTTAKKPTTQWKNGRETAIDISPRKIDVQQAHEKTLHIPDE